MRKRGLTCLALTVCVLFLAGCMTAGTRQQNFAHLQIPTGAVLVLKKAITIPRENAAVYVQDGRVVEAMDEMRPYCKFEVWRRLEEPQEIQPDRFVIRRVNWGTSHIQAGRPLKVAWIYFGHSSTPSHLYYQTELYLRSERQPDVYRIICEVDRIEASGLSYDSYLSLADIRGTLEGMMRIELPGKHGGSSPGTGRR